MIDLQEPKSEPVRVLPGEAMREPAGGGNLEIVQHDHGADWRLVHGQKKSVLAFRGVRRAINEDELRALQALKRFALGRDIEGFDGAEAVPTARQGNDAGKIGLSLGDRTFELLSPAQPICRVFDAGRPGGSAPKRVGGTSRAKFEGAAARGQKSRDLFYKAATRRWKDPGRNLGGGLTFAFVVLNEALKLTFERSICGRRIGFSDNPSELLSAFRYAFEVSARF